MRPLLLALLLLLPVPARAHFTDAELDSLRGVFGAMNNVASCFEQSMGTMGLSVNTSDAADLNVAWEALVNPTDGAWPSFARGIAYMYNVHPTSEGAACGANRAACVASAKAEFAAAITAITAARVPLTDCKTNGSAAWFRTACANGEGFLTSALTYMSDTYDPDLDYTDWRTGWYPRVAGPHGDFEAMTFQLVSGILTASAGLEQMRQSWDWVSNGESAWDSIGTTSISCFPAFNDEACAWGRLIQRMGLIIPKMQQALFAWNAIPWPGTNETPGVHAYRLRDSLSAMKLSAHAFEFVLARGSASQNRRHEVDGLPYQYDNFAADSFVVLMEAFAARPTSRALFNTGWVGITIDSWFHSDAGSWKAFEFPDDETLLELRAQKNPLNDPNGPPVTVAR